MLEEEKKIKFINEKIAQLKVYIKLNTKINLNDISIISENFFCKLLNIIFDYQLINANIFENNFLAVDLIDEKNKVVIQVTSDKSADKIQKTIEKFQTKFDNSYKLKFVIINDKKTYRKKFNIDSSYDFDIKKDVIFIEDFSQLARKNVDAIYDVIINEFFWENIERQYEWFETNNRNNIEDLGCRYNKEIDITTETYRKLENFLVDKDSLMKILLKIKKLIYSLNEFENKLVKKDKIEELKFNYLKFIKEIKIIDVDKLHCNLVDIEKNINENKESVINNLSNDGDNYTEKRKIYSIIDQCEECKDELKLVEKKVLIITGDMGTGKSHILASYIENISLKKKYETILILGQHLNDNKLFKLQIKEILEINEEFERFIKLLNAKGKEKNIIVPIFIDAINESLYNSKWKDELNSLINIMKSYKYVKLVITLRSDYIQRCLPEKIEKEDYVEIIEHNGFRDEDDIYML